MEEDGGSYLKLKIRKSISSMHYWEKKKIENPFKLLVGKNIA